MRSDAHRAQAEVNSDAYSAQNQHATDVALFLRRNVVQGIKVGEQADKETWSTGLSLKLFTPLMLP